LIYDLKEIKIDDIAKHVGDSVKFCSKVYNARYLEGSKNKPTFLNVGASYPNQLVTTVIWGLDRKAFDGNPEEIYNDKKVCISGVVELYNDKPQINLFKKEQITILQEEPQIAPSFVTATIKNPEPEPVLADRKASFPGGIDAWRNYLMNNLKVPEDLLPGEKKLVIARFLISAEGIISNIEINKSAGNLYDREVLRVLNNMPVWIPEIKNGKQVAITYLQPITFTKLDL
jgi:hypothetical protein